MCWIYRLLLQIREKEIFLQSGEQCQAVNSSLYKKNRLFVFVQCRRVQKVGTDESQKSYQSLYVCNASRNCTCQMRKHLALQRIFSKNTTTMFLDNIY